jgi:hypothetical protein
MRGQREAKPVKRGQVESASGAANVAKVVQAVDSKAGLAEANALYPAFLNLASEWSVWTFDGADHEADVTGDPTQTTYVAIESDDTGASGAWVKRIS